MHRLLHGGWRADPGIVWAAAHGLDPDSVPARREPDLFDLGPSPAELDEPIGADGSPAPGVGRPASLGGVARPAGRDGPTLALEVAASQRTAVDALAVDHPQALATARAESAAEVLCVELGA